MAEFPTFINDKAPILVLKPDETTSSFEVILKYFSPIIDRKDPEISHVLDKIKEHANEGNFNLVREIYYESCKDLRNNYITKFQHYEIILFITRVCDETNRIKDAIEYFINFMIKRYNCKYLHVIKENIFINYIRNACERILKVYEDENKIYNAVQVYNYMLKYCVKSTDLSLQAYERLLIERRSIFEHKNIQINIMLDFKRKVIREGLNTLYRIENNSYNSKLHLKYWSPMTDYYREEDYEYVMSELSKYLTIIK